MRITPWNTVSISGVLANSSASQEILFSITTYFSSPSKGIQPVHPKGNQSWIFTGRTDAEAETLILWPPDEKNWLIGKDPDAGKKLKAGEVDHRVWDGWMASLTQWTWVWVSSGSWWWTGRPGMLQSMGLQRVGHDWATELNSSSKIMQLHLWTKKIGTALLWHWWPVSFILLWDQESLPLVKQWLWRFVTANIDGAKAYK